MKYKSFFLIQITSYDMVPYYLSIRPCFHIPFISFRRHWLSCFLQNTPIIDNFTLSSSSCTFLQIVALLFSKIYYHKQVIFKCHLLLIYILFNCLNTYYFNLYIYLFDSNIIQFGPWKVNISGSDCSLYCSFICHTTCNPISSIVHSIKYIYFCTL